MQILHIDPDDIDNPLSGGGPVRTYEIYRRLAQRHQVTVLTPTFPGSTPELMRSISSTIAADRVSSALMDSLL